MLSGIIRLRSFDNASLLWTFDSSVTLDDAVASAYASIGNQTMHQGIIKKGGTLYGVTIFRGTATYGKVTLMSYFEAGLTIYLLGNGTWSKKNI